ncbi:MAG TPA: ATP/GTP-binding protein, partial [Streptomyces sp.]
MDTEGTYDARDARAHQVPRPTPPPPSKPPAGAARPTGFPPAAPVAEWLRTPRPAQEPGVWRYGYTPRPPGKPEGVSDRSLLAGVLISALSGLLLWSLWRNGYIPYRLVPLKLFTPGDWWYAGTFGGPRTVQGADALTVYEAVLFGLLLYGVGRLGNWSELFRRHVVSRGPRFLAAAAAAAAALAQLLVWKDAVPVVRPVLILVASVAGGEIYQSQSVVNVIYALIALAVLWPFALLGHWRRLATRSAGEGTGTPAPATAASLETGPAPDQWPELRAAGRTDAADALTAEVRTGRMNDVDCARLR